MTEMPLTEVLATYRPESRGGTWGGDTWRAHARFLWDLDPGYMQRHADHMRSQGGWFNLPVPVTTP